jgi:hypothetical protein
MTPARASVAPFCIRTQRKDGIYKLVQRGRHAIGA